MTYLTCDVPPFIDNGRTMLPLRALSEGLNFNVNWIDAQKVVDILEKPGYDRKLMAPDQWAAYFASLHPSEA